MQLAGPGVFGPPADRAESLAVLREAVANGVNHTKNSRCGSAREQGQSIFSAPRRVRRQAYGVSPTMRWNERVKCG